MNFDDPNGVTGIAESVHMCRPTPVIRSLPVVLLCLVPLASATLAGSGPARRPEAPAAFQLPAAGCGADTMAVQILGSGGPRINGARASSSYLVWIDGKARVLIDAGGGAFLRFGEARANLGDLSLVAISHLHPDHVSDLPALLWLSSLARKIPLPIVGPSGNDVAPDFATFLRRLFDAREGAFQVLGSTLDGAAAAGGGAGVRLDVSVADVAQRGPSRVFDSSGIAVTTLPVPHGNIPTLAYRVEAHGVSVVFGSDQTGNDPAFVDFARGADVLIMHLEIGAGGAGPAAALHATPTVVGRVARDAGVGRLIISHLGQFDLEAAVQALQAQYTGRLSIGMDLQCTPVPAV